MKKYCCVIQNIVITSLVVLLYKTVQIVQISKRYFILISDKQLRLILPFLDCHPYLEPCLFHFFVTMTFRTSKLIPLQPNMKITKKKKSSILKNLMEQYLKCCLITSCFPTSVYHNGIYYPIVFFMLWLEDDWPHTWGMAVGCTTSRWSDYWKLQIP